MRRILVERARRADRHKHGGGYVQVSLDPDHPETLTRLPDVIAIDEALTSLERLDARKAKVVSLRYFAGLTVEETADALDLSPATVKNEWAFARAWLHKVLASRPAPATPDGE